MKSTVISIPYPSIFSFKECLWFLDRNLDDCLHKIEDGAITKAIMINDEPVLIRISDKAGSLHIKILEGSTSLSTQAAIRQFINEWFDLERDLAPFYDLLQGHTSFAYMVQDFQGLRSIGIPDLFEAICWAIIGQQINLAFAYRLKRRLVELYGSAIEHEQTIYYLFPTPRQLQDANTEDLRAMQFSSMKAQYLIHVAKTFASGAISKDSLHALAGFEERQKALIAMKGVGIWTANYALMKSLKETTAVPYGDAGLNNALLHHKVIEQKTDHQSIMNVFSNFQGWESYLVFYLWRSLAKQA